MDSKTIRQLKTECKQLGLKNYSKLTKPELIKNIERVRNFQMLPNIIEESKPLRRTRNVKFTPKLGQIFKFSDKYFKEDRPIQQEIEKPFVISETHSRHIKKYNAWQIDYKITLKDQADMSTVRDAVSEMIKTVKKRTHFRKGDKLKITASNPNFHGPISTKMMQEIDASTILDHIENIVTSNEEVDINQTTFNIQMIAIPHGEKGGKLINLTTDLRTKRCITQINNNDNLCCPRAVVTALTYHIDIIFERKLTNSDIRMIRMGRKIQKDLAMELCKRLREYNEEGFTLEDIKNTENLLNIQIKVICAENFNTIIYNGEEKDIKIYLYKNQNHFDVINSMKAFLGSTYYCDKCDQSYQNKGIHRCKKSKKKVCIMCKSFVHETKDRKYCNNCNRYCYNQKCLDCHYDVCEEVYKCLNCNKIVLRNKDHKCGFEKCRNCWQEVEINKHQCYMQWKKPKGGICVRKVEGSKMYGCSTCIKNYCYEYIFECKKCKKVIKGPKCDDCGKRAPACDYSERYIFFDYEAQQETGIHISNLVIAHDFNGNVYKFKTNTEFCNWLINKEHKGYTAIAHYAKGYDTQFILKYCVENTIKPYTIYTGTKIMLLEIESIGLKIIDSSNFVAAALTTFPKTFGLKELKKGYFPHYFNTVENEKYIGPIPATNFYGSDTMKPDVRKQFLEWHKVKVEENYIFDMKKELEEYCNSDVDILRKGCLELRKEFLEIANIDPFQYLTIASVCMAIYRSKYLKENTIAVIDKEQKDMFSKKSISWLNTFKNVQHALNGGEITICGKKVDGFDKETNTVYQFYGCFWHGCPKCYKFETINNKNKLSMEDLYTKTLEHSKQIRDSGYNLVEKWECEWKFKKIDEPKIIEPLNPRDAFYGGRTNAVKLKVSNKKMGYIDICSLYPTVQYFDYYPVGHPIKILNPKYFDNKWYGLIKCKVLPPKALYHPILPIKMEKLFFPLCMKCVVDKINNCKHNDDERMLIGTWTTDEINKAIEKGYKIKEIYEVWHFEEKSTELFKGYVKDFMKIKLETSPWEGDFPTKDEYAKTIKNKLGIKLDIDKIELNPGKRAVSKICLNSMWGKFGQKQNMNQTEYVNDVKQFYEILLDDRLDMTNMNFINEDIIQVTYNYKDYYIENNTSTNIFIATFTTSNARLRLYDMLDKLKENVVMFDTDSIVYIDDGKNTVKTGCLLGEWTNELKKDEWIVKWVSTGPKSYAYETNLRNYVCKIKGFTLNYEISKKINIASMNKIINKEIDKIETEYNTITRDTTTKNLVNKRVSKIFKIDYDKRIIVHKEDVVDSLPYGY